MSQQVVSQAAPGRVITTEVAADAAPARTIGDLITAHDSKLQALGTFLGEWLLRRYSEVRVVARMKVLAFASLLTFLGLGFALKVTALNVATGTVGPIEFILANPGPVEAISATIALLFVVSANIYSRLRRQEYEGKLFELAADPTTPAEVRSAILLRLQGK